LEPRAADSGEPRVPGGVYLCQVGERVSCGACCGLYNCADHSRTGLEERLDLQTAEFRQVPRDPDAITDFQVRMERRDPHPRPFPDFYHCPFLGFVGGGRRRVGCLLHPLGEGNGGVDYRGLSFYGGMACREYFCPSCRELPAAVKETLKSVLDDWYLYGLIVTEQRLLAGFFGEIERRLGRPLPGAGTALPPEARAAMARLLELKLTWPFRAPGWPGPANYIFNDGLYPKPAVDYAAIGAPPSAHDPVFRELLSFFRSRQELMDAEAALEGLYARITWGV
jgi:hypothetical protein